MRTIKFRAWDTKEKKMLVDSVGEKPYSSDDKYIKITGSEVLYYDAPDMSYYGGGEWSEKGGEYSFMQYTGLNDKTGREIYEGDIVREVKNGSVAEVIWSNDTVSKNGEVKDIFGGMVDLTGFLSELGKFCFRWPEDRPHKAFHIQNVEVIGNVHESPSLLKP